MGSSSRRPARRSLSPSCLPAFAGRQDQFFSFLLFLKKNWKQNLHQFHHDFNNFFMILHPLSSTIDSTLSACKPTSKCLKISIPKSTFTQIQEMQNLTYLFVLLVLLRHRFQCSLHIDRHVRSTLHNPPQSLLLRSWELVQMRMIFEAK